MESAAHKLDDLLRKWGLTLSIVKTKLFVAGDSDADDMRPWMLVKWSVHMTEFTYSWGPLLKQKEGKESIGGGTEGC